MDKRKVNCLVDAEAFNEAKGILERRDDGLMSVTLTTTQVIEYCIKFFLRERGVATSALS